MGFRGGGVVKLNPPPAFSSTPAGIGLRSKNQAKSTPEVLLSSPNNILGKLVKGFMSCDRTNKYKLLHYIYIDKDTLVQISVYIEWDKYI